MTSVTAELGSTVASEPPAPTPSQALGSRVSRAAWELWASGAADAAAGTSACTNAARSTTSSVPPVASTVSSTGTAYSGTRYQTVRAKDEEPRQRGTPASGRASASSATAWSEVGVPFSAVKGAKTPAANGSSLDGGSAAAGAAVTSSSAASAKPASRPCGERRDIDGSGNPGTGRELRVPERTGAPFPGPLSTAGRGGAARRHPAASAPRRGSAAS